MADESGSSTIVTVVILGLLGIIAALLLYFFCVLKNPPSFLANLFTTVKKDWKCEPAKDH